MKWFLQLLFVLIVSSGPMQDARAADGRLRIRVTDEEGNLTPARSWVDAGGNRLFEPKREGSPTPYARDRSFSHDGVFELVVPAGEVTVHVEKGKEFRPQDVVVSVPVDTTLEHTIQLHRWIDQPARGWYSADMHVHLGQDDPRVLRQLALADDVHLLPAFTYWLRGKGDTWHREWPSRRHTEPLRIDSTHIITRNNIEVERIYRNAPPGGTIGATFLFNLNKPVSADHYGFFFPTDAHLCRVAQQHSPDVVLDADKPTWAETVVGAALGQLHTVQICHNQYARTTTEVGSYGMIGPLATGESNAALADGLFHRTNAIYYRLLNCGFRLGVSGGSAIGVKAMPAGFNRVYAKLEGPFSAEALWRAIRAGKSFATTGPMMDLVAKAEGRDPVTLGDTLRLTRPPPAFVLTASVQSIERLEVLQLIQNGRVVASTRLIGKQPEPVLREDLRHTLQPTSSCWVAARALFRAPDGQLRQAHTSPIYVEVAGAPIASAADARYLLRWIEVLTRIAQQPDRFPSEAAKRQVLADYAEARAVYDRLVAREPPSDSDGPGRAR